MFAFCALWTALLAHLTGAFFYLETTNPVLNSKSTDTSLNDSSDVTWNSTDFNWNSSSLYTKSPGTAWNVTDLDTTSSRGWTSSNGVDPEMEWVVQTHTYHCGYGTVCKVPTGINITEDENCGECSCDESCLQQDQGKGCCIDVYPKLDPPPPQEPSLTECEIVMFPYTYYTPITQMQPRMLINKCPDNIPASMLDTAAKCRQDYWSLWQSNLQDYAIPVTEKANHSRHYKNAFCALCHGLEESNFIFWQIQILSEITDFPTAVTKSSYVFMDTLRMFITQYNSYVFLQFQPPVNISEESVACKINTCNVSGLWYIYNETTERACHLYNTHFINAFENIFCAMCNVALELGIFGTDFPFSFLIDLNGLDTEPKVDQPMPLDTCSTGHMYDPLIKNCRKTSCSLYFTIADSECYSVVREIQGFSINVDLHFQLTTPQQHTDDLMLDINLPFLSRIGNLINEINTSRSYDFQLVKIIFDKILNVSYSLDGEEFVLHHVEVISFKFSLTFNLRQKHLSASQTFEDLINSLDILYQKCDTYYSMLNIQVKCTSELIYGFINLIKDSTFIEKIHQKLDKYYFDRQHAQSDNVSTLTTEKPNLSNYMHAVVPVSYIDEIPNSEDQSPIMFTRQHTCQRFHFYETEYILTKAGVYFPMANKTLPYIYASLRTDDGGTTTMGVCVETYKVLILGSLGVSSEKNLTPCTTASLSVVCSGVSVLFLMVTIIVWV